MLRAVLQIVLFVALYFAGRLAIALAIHVWGTPAALVGLAFLLVTLAWGWRKAIRQLRESDDLVSVSLMILFSAITLILLIGAVVRLTMLPE